eukprot:364397-Chlamydomonas_euryale.AAC.28
MRTAVRTLPADRITRSLQPPQIPFGSAFPRPARPALAAQHGPERAHRKATPPPHRSFAMDRGPGAMSRSRAQEVRMGAASANLSVTSDRLKGHRGAGTSTGPLQQDAGHSGASGAGDDSLSEAQLVRKAQAIHNDTTATAERALRVRAARHAACAQAGGRVSESPPTQLVLLTFWGAWPRKQSCVPEWPQATYVTRSNS